MTLKNTKKNLLKTVYDYLILLVSMSGFVPKNATIFRTIAMSASIAFAVYLSSYQPHNSSLAILYFLFFEVAYIGFITVVLSENGLVHWFIRYWGGEDDGYLAFEAILGFLFFHNAVSIGYVASATPGILFANIYTEQKDFLLLLVAILSIGGFTIKILAAKAVTIEIYYWKDMFLGRKIADFVVAGPYKYFNSPMYGIGQIGAYATAIWHGSQYGLMAALLNQFLVFSFYFLVEKKFINRVYLKPA
jgi:hypothetical protein